jgi:dinuclear metal center YbgI/SA1388 family protein
MVIRDIQQIFESWAPTAIAWEQDNIGLQVGSPKKRVRKILVALDITDHVIAEAERQQIDLIICHHPLLFKPLRSLTEEHRIGRMCQRLIQRNIAVFAAHTNLDFTAGGVSFALAEALGIHTPGILSKRDDTETKVVTFAPRNHAESIRTAMANEGAGIIGEYTSCSFQTEGVGTFRGSAASRPFIGKSGHLEQAEEIRIEMIVPNWKLPSVVTALRSVHPYEEPAYDLYPLKNTSTTYGAGVIGTLRVPVTLRGFLKKICSTLKTPAVRYSGNLQSTVHRVAVCGGSGSDMIHSAIQQRADAYVTADIRYHSFDEPDNRMALIDAGHFETEAPAIQTIVTKLRHHPTLKKDRVTITASRAMKNPVQYFLS